MRRRATASRSRSRRRSVRARGRRRTIWCWSARAAEPAPREIIGRNITLLIDVSGSMAPAERLPLIKTALGMFVDTLRPDDTLSIVTYAGESGIALYPTPARQRNVIQDAIARLNA